MTAPDGSRTTRVEARPAPEEPNTVVLLISGSITRDEIPPLCTRVRALLQGSARGLVVCDVAEVTDPDAVTVDALSRLRLIVRRLGRDLRVARASAELHELTDLMGLTGVLAMNGRSDLEPRGQAEQGKEPRGVEKERDPGDPAV